MTQLLVETKFLKYGKKASNVMRELVQFVNGAIANEEDFQSPLRFTLRRVFRADKN